MKASLSILVKQLFNCSQPAILRMLLLASYCLIQSFPARANDSYLKIELSDFNNSILIYNHYYVYDKFPELHVEKVTVGNYEYNTSTHKSSIFPILIHPINDVSFIGQFSFHESFNVQFDRCGSASVLGQKVTIKGKMTYLGLIDVPWEKTTYISSSKGVNSIDIQVAFPSPNQNTILGGMIRFNMNYEIHTMSTNDINHCEGTLPKEVRLRTEPATMPVKWWKKIDETDVEQTHYDKRTNLLEEGTYKITSQINGCHLEKSFSVGAENIPQINLGPSTRYICDGDEIILSTGLSESELSGWGVTWYFFDYTTLKTLSGTQQRAKEAGIYVLFMEKDGCYQAGQVIVHKHPKPQPYFPEPVLELDWGENVQLQPSGVGTNDRLSWPEGQNGSFIVVDKPGRYYVLATNEFGCSTPAYVSVYLNDENTPQPYHDGKKGERVLDQVSLADVANGAELIKVQDAGAYRQFDVHQNSTIVNLFYNRTEHTDLQKEPEADLVKIQYRVEYASGQMRAPEYGELSLSLTDEYPVYRAMNVHTGGKEVALRISSVTFIKSNVAVTPTQKFMSDFRLELVNKINFQPKMIPDQTIASLSHTMTDGKIKFYWKHFHSAYEYELEYVFIDKYTAVPSGQAEYDRLFREQAVRVSTFDTYYDLFPTFPEGKLYYRVRPVGRHIYSDPVTYAFGLWTNYYVVLIQSGAVPPFEASRNWEKTLTFAEGGKKKEIISYYDKMLRPTQVATHLSSDKITLFAETHYDHEGRPVVNVLPVPYMDQSGLHFKELLTRSYDDPLKGYSRADFDLESQLQKKVSNLSGAGKYYSPDNELHTLGLYKKADLSRIPDAGGAVTTQVRYSLDATGRVTAQSGVGEQFALNDPAKRFSRMFYGTPSPTELRRMFGSNVGASIFYKKSMVVDPNGQISISYADMKGNTIATCLAGETPGNLEELDNNQGESEFTFSLNENNRIDEEKLESVTQATILNTHLGTYTFSYDVDGIINQLNTGLFVEEPACAACIYDLEISIIDPEGKPVALTWEGQSSEDDPFTFTKRIEPASTWEECPSENSYAVPELAVSAFFNQFGNYVVTKKLTLAEGAIDRLIELAITTGVIPTLEQLQLVAENKLAVFNPCTCEGRCEIFVEELMLSYEPEENGPTKEAYRQQKKDECMMSYCEALTITENDIEKLTESECGGILEQIKSQLGPGGPFFASVSCQLPAINKLQDFVPGNENAEYDEEYYRQLYESLTESGANIEGILTEKWDDEIANLFAPLHREFPHYAFCTEHGKELSRYQYEMSLVRTWSEAMAKGYVASKSGVKNTNGAPYGTKVNGKGGEDPVMNYVPDFVNELKLPIDKDGDEYIYEPLWFVLDYLHIPASEEDIIYVVRQHLLVKPGAERTSRPVPLLPHDDDPEVLATLDTLKWEMYKNVYVGKRFAAINKYKRNSLGIEFFTGENVIVEDVSYMMDMTYAEENNTRLAKELCEDACDGNAAMWLASMAGRCVSLNEVYTSDDPADKQKIAGILSEMKRICKTNCGDGFLNPWGMLSPDDAVVREVQIGQILGLLNDFSCTFSTEDTRFIFPTWNYTYMGSDTRDSNLNYLLSLFAFGSVHTGHMNIGQTSQTYHSDDRCNSNEFIIRPLADLLFWMIEGRIEDVEEQRFLDRIIEDNGMSFRHGKCASSNSLNENLKLFRLALWLFYPEYFKYSFNSTRVSNGFNIDMNLTRCYKAPGVQTDQGCPTCTSYVRFYDGQGNVKNVGNNGAVITFNNTDKSNKLGIPYTTTHPALNTMITEGYGFHNGDQLILDPYFSNGYSASMPAGFSFSGGVVAVDWVINHTTVSIAEPITNINGLILALNSEDPDGGWFYRTEHGGKIVIYGGNAEDSYGPLRLWTSGGMVTIPFVHQPLETAQIIKTFANPSDAADSLAIVNAERTLAGLELIDDSYSGKDEVYTNLEAYFENLGIENEEACACETRFTMTGGEVKYCYFPDRTGWFPCSSTTCLAVNPGRCSSVDFEDLTTAQSRIFGFHYYYLISEIPKSCDPVVYPYLTKGKFVIGIDCDPNEEIECTEFDLPGTENELTEPCFICPGAIGSELNWIETCNDEARKNTRDTVLISYQDMIARLRLQFYLQVNNCMKGLDEDFRYSHETGQYQYTLYYYDQANNLVQTIPPEGVDLLEASDFENGRLLPGRVPEHRLRTTYQYNSRGQVIRQISPDGGESRFWYNRLGQLRFSQNAKQATDNKYAFTVYDRQGRISFVGEYDNSQQLKQMDDMTLLMSTFPLEDGALNEDCSQITETQYDYSRIEGLPFGENLRNRVAASLYYDHPDERPVVYNDGKKYAYRAALYDYDEIGNVKNIWQIYRTPAVMDGLTEIRPEAYRKFKISYDYDLYSGKVNKVEFLDADRPQGRKGGYFMHRYEYDSDNRITAIYSTKDGYIEQCEARYFYYPHGPLARTELGHEQVQGIDYAYTLQGWLKYINEPQQDPAAAAHPLHQHTGIPEYSVMLGYFREDYVPIAGTPPAQDIWDEARDYYETDQENIRPHARELYNGNISWMQTATAQSLDVRFPASSPAQSAGIQTNNGTQIMAYNYDQLNRIKGTQTYGLTGAQVAYTGLFDEQYKYDANGNIERLTRYAAGASGTPPVMVDDLIYRYQKNGLGQKINNQLSYVDDQIGTYAALAADAHDIQQGQTAGNYEYDDIGNLTADGQEGIEKILWNTYGKISEIHYLPETDKPDLAFLYDATGNRVAKIVIPKDEHKKSDTTWYVRDAQGNVLYTEHIGYQYSESQPEASFISEEYHLYGSSRVGMMQDRYPVSSSAPALNLSPGDYYLQLGKKRFELNNHLGNVLATVSDLPVGSESGRYISDLLMTQDYYPFGMLMPGRSYEKGQCVVTETAGSGELLAGNDFNASESSADGRGISDWSSQVKVLRSLNQLRLGELGWYNRSAGLSPDGAMLLTARPLMNTGNSMVLAVRDLDPLPPGNYRLSMDMFGTEQIEGGMFFLVKTSDLLSGSFNFLGGEEDEEEEEEIALPEADMIAGDLIVNEIHHDAYFELGEPAELSLVIAGTSYDNSIRSFLVDNIRIESLAPLSGGPVVTYTLQQDFSEGEHGWRILDLDKGFGAHFYTDKLASKGHIERDTLTGVMKVYGLEGSRDNILLARDYATEPGKIYQIGFTIDSLYNNYNLHLNVSETGDLSRNIWWNNKIPYYGLSTTGHYVFEVEAHTDDLTLLFSTPWDSTRTESIPYFSIRDVTLTECTAISPAQETEMYADSFATGSYSGFTDYSGQASLSVDTTEGRLVQYPYVDNYGIPRATYSLKKDFSISEYGKYRLSMNIQSSGHSEMITSAAIRAHRQPFSSLINYMTGDISGDYTVEFYAYTDTVEFNLWNIIEGDTTQELYISDVKLERIHSTDSCALLAESGESYTGSWRTGVWSEAYASRISPPDMRMYYASEFGSMRLDSADGQLLAQPFWLEDVLTDTLLADSGVYVSLLARDMQTEPGKQYRIDFDLEVNDSTSFGFLLAGAWKTSLTGVLEPAHTEGFENVISVEESGSYSFDFVATSDRYTFEILGMSDSTGFKPQTAYRLDNVVFSILDISDSILEFTTGFDSLSEDIYSYFRESGDTIEMGAISYDTTAGRLRIDLIPQGEDEYIGAVMKDVELESDRYYRLRSSTEAHGSVETGLLAVTSNHSESGIHSLKMIDANGKGELLFHSGSGGIQTLLLAVIGGSGAYYYADSLSLEQVTVNDSVLYSNDFSTTAAGWRTRFADSSFTQKAGMLTWSAPEEALELSPYADESRYFGAIVRPIPVQPGTYNKVQARVRVPDTLDISVSLGVYNEPSEQVRMSTLSSVPYAYMKAAHFRDTVLEFSFTPRRDRMSLVLMYKGGDGSALSIDDVEVFYADGFERDTLVQMPFTDSSEVKEHWRSSSWPDSMIVLDSMIWGTLSHDTTLGRMRVDLTENPFGDEGTENELGSLSIRRLSGLEVDREYEVSTRIYTDGANRLYRIGMNLFNASEFGMGIINDAGPHVQLDSLTMADSLVFRFRATEGDMVLAISSASRIGETYHYYLDDFRLRDGMVKSVDCSRGNLLYAEKKGYRYGFNGQERENELNPSITSAEYWMYDGRLGRRWNVDPEYRKYPSESPYLVFHNNPILFSDPNGNEPPSLNEIWSFGTKSKALIKLANAAKIKTTDLGTSKIAMGDASETNSSTGEISINKEVNLGGGVTALTHELTNRKNLGAFAYQVALVRIGEIDAKEYAKNTLMIESEGIMNQIIVTSELITDQNNIADIAEQFQISELMAGLAIEYKAGEISEKDVKNEVLSNIENSIIRDTGETALEFYEKQGKGYRGSESKRESKMSKEQIKMKNDRIKATAKKVTAK